MFVAIPGETCDYLEVLHCYSPLLSKFGIITWSITPRQKDLMRVMKRAVLNNAVNQCVTQRWVQFGPYQINSLLSILNLKKSDRGGHFFG